jgi:hypothetical protein
MGQSNFQGNFCIYRRPSTCLYPSGHHKLKEDIMTILKGHCDAGQPLFTSIAQDLIRNLIQKKAPHLLDNESQSGLRSPYHGPETLFVQT